MNPATSIPSRLSTFRLRSFFPTFNKDHHALACHYPLPSMFGYEGLRRKRYLSNHLKSFESRTAACAHTLLAPKPALICRCSMSYDLVGHNNCARMSEGESWCGSKEVGVNHPPLHKLAALFAFFYFHCYLLSRRKLVKFPRIFFLGTFKPLVISYFGLLDTLHKILIILARK